MAEYIPSPRDWVREQVELYESSGGTKGTTLRETGLPVIIVTNTGNKTGGIRKTPLMRVKDGANYVLVGSQGGAPKDPVWVHNLRAQPAVEIRDLTVVQPMRVREVKDEAERARLWALAVAAFPPYAEYQARPPGRFRSSSQSRSASLARGLPGFTERFAKVNGVRLHFLIGGQGSPVVLLHGYAETGHMWRPIMALLAQRLTVVVPDLRGWIRTAPYVKAWHRDYADRGLVVIGVHAPEFEFGKRAENIDRGFATTGSPIRSHSTTRSRPGAPSAMTPGRRSTSSTPAEDW